MATAQPRQPLTGDFVWTAREMAAREDWLYTLDAGDVAELAAAAQPIVDAATALPTVGREHFPLPRFAETLAALRRRIVHGLGFVQIRGLPVGTLGRHTAATIFWGIGRHLGDDVVMQNAKGYLLDHVKDLGQTFADPTSRGPYTRERIEYHSDACDVVGLLCLQPAKSGGESTLASAGAVYNEMLRRRPDLVDALLAPVYRDRRGEIPPGAEPWYAMPVFNFHQGHFALSNEPSYIDSVARFFEQNPNTPAQLEALHVMDELAEELHFAIAFEPGDMQFLHNHTVMHSRQAFTDFDEPARKRHLLRIWLLTHDGPPLSPALYARNGTPRTVRRPGGITGANTTPHCPLDLL